ncbi:MAG: hypothetical protein A2270_03175 [Elusimicrobia bacterium RIFOXYA12_FULL_51_18]|nr:MAG: hypothetical protein A2270_03175 [Elusimicrobia bacterium RIFOXYA12_FULL_51_18]OGS31851.1 MAG: hypothetical protein A2218_06140 [Elusimicrobia bacterium RIFOXYA2_FULL_53_38]
MNFSLRPLSLNNLPPATRGLVLASFCGWVLEMAFGWRLNYYFGLVPAQVTGSGWLWQPFTYIFIHAGFLHFLFNAFMLWMLGTVIEPVLGSRKFFVYFLFCGAAAALLTVAASLGSTRAVIGASGAIYGLLYAFAALYPEQTVYVYFLFPMTARQFVIFMAGISLVLSFTTPNSGVANFTHLSGLAAGWLYFNVPGWLRKVEGLKLKDENGEWKKASKERERVDAILEKISSKGEGALTAAERRELDAYARGKGGRA